MNTPRYVRLNVAGAADSTASPRKPGRAATLAGACALAFVSAAGVLEAAPIQFTFDCTIVDATTCTPSQVPQSNALLLVIAALASLLGLRRASKS